jgi:hypothetical protein
MATGTAVQLIRENGILRTLPLFQQYRNNHLRVGMLNQGNLLKFGEKLRKLLM